jgi:outer membrane protein assembly factor BamD (BamD/ComL family)
MTGSVKALAAVIGVMLCVQVSAAQTTRPQPAPRGTWELTDEGVRRIESPAETAGPAAQPEPELDRVAELLDRGRFGAGRSRVIRWLRDNPQSPARDRALLQAARSFVGTGNRVKAFYYCDELLDTYPESTLYPEALQLQYDAADDYLSGVRERSLGFIPLTQPERGIEMLFRVQQRSPGSPLAERALIRTADYYWEDGQFDIAADVYQSYVTRFPRSPLAPMARLREAYANLAQFRGALYDPAPLINARTILAEMIDTYPDLAEQEDFEGKLELADRQFARKLYLKADWYRRTGQPESAAYVCRRAIELYPGLPETEDVRRLLERLEPS